MRPHINTFSKTLSNKSYSRWRQPLAFDEQLDVLIYYHLQGFDSGRHLLQALEKDELAKELVSPENGLKKSTLFEAINSRGLDQLFHVYNKLYSQAKTILPNQYPSLGDIVGVDSSLITATLSMDWADYRGGA